MSQIALTNLSSAGGCGCKQNEMILSEVLKATQQKIKNSSVVMSFDSNDDCAVMDIGGDEYLLMTTDFFTPVVDDPYTYGVVTAANALSDVYAMGGKPFVANVILGYPREHILPDTLREIIRGGTQTLENSECIIVGGHTIENPQPIYGFTILGKVEKSNLKKNTGAQPGDILVLTKPLGIGIYSNALKLGLLADHLQASVQPYLRKVNTQGYPLGKLPSVHAMTDVTGFGLVGHALEMCRDSTMGLELYHQTIPYLAEVEDLVHATISPQSGIMKNYKNYIGSIELKGEHSTENILPLFDPQTNGGLLIAVAESELDHVLKIAGPDAVAIGKFVEREEGAYPLRLVA
ncbi:MAG: selenide, water dikinase SelD [Holosporales bacterium]